VFDHVTIRASHREASERFYDELLPVLRIAKTHSDERFAEWDDFSLAQAENGSEVTRRLHAGFVAPSQVAVDEFWRRGTAAGYTDDGAPGPRPQYGDDYYGSFLLDPDGNSAEAVHHDSLRRGGVIDHVWIRVANVSASKRFYELVARVAGLRLTYESPERVQFAGSSGSFSLVAGPPTEHVHLAFPSDSNATVEAFHRAAVEAGYHDNGAPGERVAYHPGYFGAYVLDPDGHNVEVVNHNR
jgi:catechol 2,3-dioxygenase-like lactoylglutathione lyase family enzyme